jgi:hypothetical protein
MGGLSISNPEKRQIRKRSFRGLGDVRDRAGVV